jgi:hypothetical protein
VLPAKNPNGSDSKKLRQLIIYFNFYVIIKAPVLDCPQKVRHLMGAFCYKSVMLS